MINNTVYTYYEEISDINNDKHRQGTQQELIDLCQKSWERSGWQLKVLSYKDAQTHPFYEEYRDIIESLPSVNPDKYDYHCYMRWLAMARVGGGLMIDYDVINLNITPSELHNYISSCNTTNPIVLQYHVPCVVYGNQNHYIQMCENFMRLKNNDKCIEHYNNRPHTSDMLMIAYGLSDENVYKIRYVKAYAPDTEFSNCLIHCSQASAGNGNSTKKQIMTTLLGS